MRNVVHAWKNESKSVVAPDSTPKWSLPENIYDSWTQTARIIYRSVRASVTVPNGPAAWIEADAAIERFAPPSKSGFCTIHKLTLWSCTFPFTLDAKRKWHHISIKYFLWQQSASFLFKIIFSSLRLSQDFFIVMIFFYQPKIILLIPLLPIKVTSRTSQCVQTPQASVTNQITKLKN